MKFRDDVFNQHSDNAQQITNRSKQFEARFAMVEVADSPSNFFQGMSVTQAPVAVAHGECCADFTQTGSMDDALVELQGASPAQVNSGFQSRFSVAPAGELLNRRVDQKNRPW